MKIGLITIWREKNYGAEMQTYATVKALQNLGHTVEVIDFRLSDISHPTLKQRIIKMLTSITKEDAKFRKFWRKNIPAGRHYRSLDELRKSPPTVDMLMVGSDQVWNPEITKDKTLAYFLDFGLPVTKRVSYASSFGVAKWNAPKQLTDQVSQLLNRFTALSSRELAGVEILNNTFGLNSVNVLDPTLLHPSYPELTGELTPKSSLVYYPLSPYPELEAFSKRTAVKLGLEFVNANSKSYMVRKIVWDRPSIEDWVKTIAEAELVVTPSFHGVAFSIIYHRQFIVVMNPSLRSRSSRITSLLSQLGLENRIFESVESASKSTIFNQNIDYEDVDKRLAKLRGQSYDFLKSL